MCPQPLRRCFCRACEHDHFGRPEIPERTHGAGHWVHVDGPQEFARIVLEFRTAN